MGEYCLVGEKYSEDFLLEQNPAKDHILWLFECSQLKMKLKRWKKVKKINLKLRYFK